MISETKIQNLEALGKLIAGLKAQGKRIVLCHGCFDLMHPGHIKHLNAARDMGDRLVVTISPDRYIDKGPHRPVFREQLRAESVAALACVDFVAVNDRPTAVELLDRLKPDIYVKGQEFESAEDPTGKLNAEKETVEKHGGKMAFTHETVFSSSNLINRFMDVFPEAFQNALSDIRQEIGLDQVLSTLDKLSRLRVLVTGDSIVHTREYCRPLERAGRSNTLSTRHIRTSTHAGGACAVAGFAAMFSDNCTLLSVRGEQRAFPRPPEALNEETYRVPGRQTIHIKDFLDTRDGSLLFQNQSGNHPVPSEADNTEIIHRLSRMDKFDILLLADMGYGTISSSLANELRRKTETLSVLFTNHAAENRQVDPGAFPGIDAMTVTRDITRGDGSQSTLPGNSSIPKILYDGPSGSCFIQEDRLHMPGLVGTHLETPGEPEAFFALTALLSKVSADPRVILLLGNLISAMVANQGRSPHGISGSDLIKYLTSIMK
ncbi:MAG: adenylyltransferase/cytidyltransferase family protein [Desulfobacter sp.]